MPCQVRPCRRQVGEHDAVGVEGRGRRVEGHARRDGAVAELDLEPPGGDVDYIAGHGLPPGGVGHTRTSAAALS